MAKESARLGSARVHKVVHVGRNMDDAQLGRASGGVVAPALGPILHEVLSRGCVLDKAPSKVGLEISFNTCRRVIGRTQRRGSVCHGWRRTKRCYWTESASTTGDVDAVIHDFDRLV
ncbi:hypothetical protein BHE74_00003024 [Ensete ventricosum]|nr:hypothetical protein GW17_00025334 [Ensete ventricosum]RWW88113.1 hypothetical protein BHE74_00003024 [Ensete ventricosum]RZR79351.1 hypothetical protein BHM03_00005067 [Ensete ventricosum]